MLKINCLEFLDGRKDVASDVVLICVTSKVVNEISQIREAIFLALIFLSTHAQL